MLVKIRYPNTVMVTISFVKLDELLMSLTRAELGYSSNMYGFSTFIHPLDNPRQNYRLSLPFLL